jgi:hypothetical protein
MSRPVAEKLLIRAGTTLWTSDPSRLPLIGPLPAGVRVVDDPTAATTAIVFAPDERTVRAVFAAHVAALRGAAALWILYPKANRTDVNRDSLWRILADHGVRPITQIAVDDVWSGLRFRNLNPAEAATAHSPTAATAP